MEKVIKDGNVAVLISVGFGAGWYSWNTDHETLLFHPKLVEMVEQGKADQIDEDWIKENLGIDDVCCDGADDLVIMWLPVGTLFEVDEYAGAECIRTIYNRYIVA